MRQADKSKWLKREELIRRRAVRMKRCADRVERVLNRCLFGAKGERPPRGKPLECAARLLRALPVFQSITGLGWSDATREAHQADIEARRLRMRGGAA